MAHTYSSAVAEIKSRCNIVDVIAPLVPLTKAGSNWKGCCPFHKEKTASFIVSETKQIYHCFGCGASGDVIGFVMQYYNQTFPEAVERLAAQYGVVIDSTSNESASNKKALFEINKTAAKYFWETMKQNGNPGLKYMLGRKIEPKTLEKFGIGYADEDFNSLTNYLLKAGLDKDLIAELGIAKKSDKNGKLYDKFRSRVMFPIIDTRGNVIGFGGRVLDGSEPKYLNSDESSVFLKKNNLYGLNLAKEAIQQEGYSFIVEGYMDVISLYQAGVKNVTASLGTALTDNQAKLLKRYTNKVILCYDSDGAGIKAALRGIDVLRAQNLEIKVLNVVGAKDPDEYIKKFGKDEFIKLAKEKSVTDVDYKVMLISKKYDVKDTAEGIKYLKAVAGVLKPLSPVEADIYIRKIAKENGISEGALRREVEGTPETNMQNAYEKRNAEEKVKADKTDPSEKMSLMFEKTMIKLALLRSDYFKAFAEYPESIVSPAGEEIHKALAQKYSEGVDFDVSSIAESLTDTARIYLNEIVSDVQIGNDSTAYKDCIDRLEINKLNNRKQQILDILDLLGEDNNLEADKLMKEFQELQIKINQLKR